MKKLIYLIIGLVFGMGLMYYYLRPPASHNVISEEELQKIIKNSNAINGVNGGSFDQAELLNLTQQPTKNGRIYYYFGVDSANNPNLTVLGGTFPSNIVGLTSRPPYCPPNCYPSAPAPASVPLPGTN